MRNTSVSSLNSSHTGTRHSQRSSADLELRVMRKLLASQQLLRAAFLEWDRSGTGSLTTKEFGRALQSLGFSPSAPEVAVATLQCTRTGRVDFTAFLGALGEALVVGGGGSGSPRRAGSAVARGVARRASPQRALGRSKPPPSRGRGSPRSASAAGLRRPRVAVRLQGLDVARARAVFAEFDDAGDGTLSMDRVAAALRQLGLTSEQVTVLLNEADEYGGELVDFENYLQFVTSGPNGGDSEELRRLGLALESERLLRQQAEAQLDTVALQRKQDEEASTRATGELIGALQEELSRAKVESSTALERLGHANEELVRELAAMRAQWGGMVEQRQDLAVQFGAEVAKARDAKAVLWRARADADERLHDTARRLRDVSEENAELKAELAAKKERLQALSHAVGNERAERAKLAAQLSALQDEVTEAKLRLVDTDVEMDVLVAECAKLKSRLADAGQTMQSVQRQKQALQNEMSFERKAGYTVPAAPPPVLAPGPAAEQQPQASGPPTTQRQKKAMSNRRMSVI